MRSTEIRRRVLRRFENGRGFDHALPRVARGSTILRAIIKTVFFGIVIFVAASLARHALFPDVMPVSWDYEPPETWSLQAAFLLLTIENMAAIILGIAAISLTALYVARLRRGRQS